ncbi:MAG: hypothetical protein ACP5IY_07690, partial [Halothiobacillaceae bacterium]
WLGLRVLRRNDHPLIQRLAMTMMGAVLIELLIGLSLALLGFPAFLQPLHLMLAALVFGLQMALFSTAQYALSSRVGGQEGQARAEA